MLPRSMRLRLSLTYAGIALLATLLLGIILVTTLRFYYRTREDDYLRANAQAVGGRLAPLIASGAEQAVLQAHVEGYAFLLRTRVRIVDSEGHTLADSGLPTELTLELSAQPLANDLAAGAERTPGPVGVYETHIVVKHRSPEAAGEPAERADPPAPVPPAAPGPGATAADLAKFEQLMRQFAERMRDYGKQLERLAHLRSAVSRVSVADTLYGFNLGPDVVQNGPHSNRRIDAPLLVQEGARPIGYVELSDGPSYGGELVDRVAILWIVASVLATALAAAAGWRLSRRMTAPLVALTNVTARMAAGDLATRAAIQGRDEIGALAQSFNAMAGRIEEIVSTLRRFVADAAHELNTPLTALRTNLDLALETANADDRAAFVEQARMDVERLERLTNDLLDLSHVESALPHERYLPLDLTALVRELSESYSAQAEQAGVEFTLVLPAEAMPIRGNETQVRRALGNLVDNAIKYTPAGGAVELQVSGDDMQVRAIIADTGIGIPPDDLPQLFSRFHRARNTAGYAGSGLGLAIVKAIMARHGGVVAARNTGAGACFTLVWPRDRSDGVQGPAISSTLPDAFLPADVQK
jgi:signal transduction histidine kinase